MSLEHCNKIRNNNDLLYNNNLNTKLITDYLWVEHEVVTLKKSTLALYFNILFSDKSSLIIIICEQDLKYIEPCYSDTL